MSDLVRINGTGLHTFIDQHQALIRSMLLATFGEDIELFYINHEVAIFLQLLQKDNTVPGVNVTDTCTVTISNTGGHGDKALAKKVRRILWQVANWHADS